MRHCILHTLKLILHRCLKICSLGKSRYIGIGITQRIFNKFGMLGCQCLILFIHLFEKKRTSSLNRRMLFRALSNRSTIIFLLTQTVAGKSLVGNPGRILQRSCQLKILIYPAMILDRVLIPHNPVRSCGEFLPVITHQTNYSGWFTWE